MRAVAALLQKLPNRLITSYWLNGEKLGEPEDSEPLYGKTYLPSSRSPSLPHDNCTDVLAQCLGFMAISEGGKPDGYNFYIGGGQGQTNSKPDTCPLCARHRSAISTPVKSWKRHKQPCGFSAIRGNRRGDRKRALKYVMKDWGVEKFREVFSAISQHPLRLPKHVPITGLDLTVGREWEMGNGSWPLG